MEKNINSSKTTKLNSQKQQEKLKRKLMHMYNISEIDAEIVLKKLENVQIDKQEKNNIPSKSTKNKNESKKNHDANDVYNDYDKNNSKTLNKTNIKNHTNVDLIMEDIIPDYNKDISIELNHVDLSFDIYDDKIDTLKEDFIRTIKRNKSKIKSFKALNDVTFKIYKGEKIGVIGYNGAGKSTLLNVITGIYPPDSGTVITHGNISPLLSLGAGFDYNYTGRENILLNGAILGYEKEFLINKIEDIIEFSELGKFIDVPIKNYSAGMLAKLGFSIATLVNPDILIIDEILSVGDVNFQKKSSDKIRSLMDGGTTVLLVSHSIPQIRELCDKAIWIDQGRLREIGEVNKICDNYIKDSEKATTTQLNNIRFK